MWGERDLASVTGESTGNPLEGSEPGSGLGESLSDFLRLVCSSVELCSHINKLYTAVDH